MRVLISGSSGLVGSALTRQIRRLGHEVLPLVRVPKADMPYWDPSRGEIAAERLEGFDAVIHLAGESIAAGRWTAERRHRIRDSRVGATSLLAGALAAAEAPPHVLLSASAVGYYGDRGEEWLDEQSPPGQGFLARLVADWEAAATPAAEAGIRLVTLRTGSVLDPGGGLLPRLTPLFLAGLGGRLGSGRQYLSWITLDDLLAAILFILETETLCGPVNATAPKPVSNAEFTRSFARALGRPTFLAVPAFALRLAYGEMAGELLLSGQRARPAKLMAAGFVFRHPDLESALSHLYNGNQGEA